MTNKRAIYRLESLKSWFKEDSEQYIAIDKAIKALQRPTGWTPVSEGLPETEGRYLVTTNSSGVDVYTLHYGYPLFPVNESKRSNPDWYVTAPDGDYYYTHVVAWQPLPEPYKGE